MADNGQRGLHFAWDDDKACANVRDHGVTFAEAEEDIKAGRVSGPFATINQLKRHLNTQQ